MHKDGPIIADKLAGLKPAYATRERKLRIAEGIATRCVERGLWTQEEADEFLEAVRERMEGTC